jgi:hypothetical protein
LINAERRVTILDVMWKERRDLVETEMKKLLGVMTLDPSSDAYFIKRSAAASLAYEGLSTLEKQEIEKLRKKYKSQANEPEIQQRCVMPVVVLLPVPVLLATCVPVPVPALLDICSLLLQDCNEEGP